MNQLDPTRKLLKEILSCDFFYRYKQLILFLFQGYSAWVGDYRYNEDLGKVFMACNLVSGMFQRLDKLHKNGFGSVCIFSGDGKIQIGSLWIFRGQNLPFKVNSPVYTFIYIYRCL